MLAAAFSEFCSSHQNAPCTSFSWCNWEGKPPSWVGPRPSVSMVSHGEAFGSPIMLNFRDPATFVAGSLSSCAAQWRSILHSHPKREEFLSYITDGVNIFQFFTPFKGPFQGKHYCSDTPPRAAFPNSSSCGPFSDFISKTIVDRVRNGSLRIVGKVGSCSPPHLVLPITIEPSKPRMCHDERFLNLWIKDFPFCLDYITDLIRYVGPNHFQTTLDEKSGYDHVRLNPCSYPYFGLEWQGWYFTYATLPFGWKASAFIYHSIGLGATSFIRSLGVPCSQYIDDRHVGQLRLPRTHPSSFTNLELAHMAAFIACSTLISLGYFIGLTKSCLEPTTAIRFLGYISDSRRQAFILPEDKRAKFSSLRESILSNKSVSLKNLQKFAGKTTSFALLVPAAKLYSNCAYQSISKAIRSGSTKIPISSLLCQEISHWRFLDSWTGCLPWKSEFHHQVQLYTDASNTGWGGCLIHSDQTLAETRGYWNDHERRLPISAKETLALLRVLESFNNQCLNARLDVLTDSKVLIAGWERQVSKCADTTATFKEIFEFCISRNAALSLKFVPSSGNLADHPSRVLSDLDSTLNPYAWSQVERAFGPHSVDLMALPSNVMSDPSGHPLRFFSPTPCKEAAGTNIFAQSIATQGNAYVFPPFVLVGPLLRFLLSQDCAFTIVTPDLRPRKYWWPILDRAAAASFILGRKGNPNVLLFPSKSASTSWEPRPLPWDLWVFRVPGPL